MEIDYTFRVRRNQANLKDESKNYCRIFSSNKTINFSTGEFVKPTHWRNDLRKGSSKNPKYKAINEHLERIEQKIRKIARISMCMK